MLRKKDFPSQRTNCQISEQCDCKESQFREHWLLYPKGIHGARRAKVYHGARAGTGAGHPEDSRIKRVCPRGGAVQTCRAPGDSCLLTWNSWNGKGETQVFKKMNLDPSRPVSLWAKTTAALMVKLKDSWKAANMAIAPPREWPLRRTGLFSPSHERCMRLDEPQIGS